MSALKIDQARFNMIEQQIRPWDVLDPQVLDILASTPREAFVPDAHRALAFSDLEIPLDHDQQMMSPKLEGRVLQSLCINPQDTVLEIGTGSGYLTACLARLGRSVLSVDLYSDFQHSTREKLATQGIDNVEMQEQDAAEGWQGEQRFDVIAVTGSLPVLHEGFHRSLTIGGRLFLIVGQFPIMEAILVTRVGESQWSRESLLETSVRPLVHTEPPAKFVF